MDRFSFVNRLVGSMVDTFDAPNRNVRIPVGFVYSPDPIGESLERIRVRFASYHRPYVMPYNFQTEVPDGWVLSGCGGHWVRTDAPKPIEHTPYIGEGRLVVRGCYRTIDGKRIPGTWDRASGIFTPNTKRTKRSAFVGPLPETWSPVVRNLDAPNIGGVFVPNDPQTLRTLLSDSRVYDWLMHSAMRTLSNMRVGKVKGKNGLTMEAKPILTESEQARRRSARVWDGHMIGSADPEFYATAGIGDAWIRLVSGKPTTNPTNLLVIGSALSARTADRRKYQCRYGTTVKSKVIPTDNDVLKSIANDPAFKGLATKRVPASGKERVRVAGRETETRIIRSARGGVELDLRNRENLHKVFDYLTDRERDVLGLLARGLSKRAIANSLAMDPSTISDLMAKIRKREVAKVEAA